MTYNFRMSRPDLKPSFLATAEFLGLEKEMKVPGNLLNSLAAFRILGYRATAACIKEPEELNVRIAQALKKLTDNPSDGYLPFRAELLKVGSKPKQVIKLQPAAFLGFVFSPDNQPEQLVIAKPGFYQLMETRATAAEILTASLRVLTSNTPLPFFRGHHTDPIQLFIREVLPQSFAGQS